MMRDGREVLREPHKLETPAHFRLPLPILHGTAAYDCTGATIDIVPTTLAWGILR
jgi:hypothetical protein